MQAPAPALALRARRSGLALQAEDQLSSQWPLCLDKDERAGRVSTALRRPLKRAEEAAEADLVLVDVGPNLGAINRAALLAADFVVVPLAPDLISLQGLRNLGPALSDDGLTEWKQRRRYASEMSGSGRSHRHAPKVAWSPIAMSCFNTPSASTGQ